MKVLEIGKKIIEYFNQIYMLFSPIFVMFSVMYILALNKQDNPSIISELAILFIVLICFGATLHRHLKSNNEKSLK